MKQYPNWRDSMLNDEQLQEILHELELDWFFENLNSQSVAWWVESLMVLPQPYLDKVKSFVGSYSIDELKELQPNDFVEQATGEKLHVVSMMIRSANKKLELEKDFK